MISSIDAYTDGSALMNGSGPAGYGVIIRYYEDNGEGMPEAKEIELSQGYIVSTNNRMEITAVLVAMNKILELLEKPEFIDVRQASISSDSEYVVKAISQDWLSKWLGNNWMTSGYGGRQPKPVKNKDLFEKIIDAIAKIKAKRVTIVMNWIKGHDGNEFNERCDSMARQAANGELIHDEGYETVMRSN